MSKWSLMIRRPPELDVASVIYLQQWKQNFPLLPPRVTKFILMGRSVIVKASSLVTGQVFESDGFTYIFVPMAYSQTKVCVQTSKSANTGQLHE